MTLINIDILWEDIDILFKDIDMQAKNIEVLLADLATPILSGPERAS